MASGNYQRQRIDLLRKRQYPQYNHQQKKKSRFAWTGFRGKTLWDWLQLLAALAIPVVVALGTLWFTAAQSQASQKASTQQHQTDLQIANDQQQETALQNYLDRISDLLLNYNLSKSKPSDEVREVARSRTLTLLPHLNGTRKREVLQFLHESGLIHTGLDTIVSLVGADLSSTDLSGANLTGDNLSDADLSNADLTGDNLINNDLSGADLRYANLSYTYLNHADLRYAHLSHADLRYAELIGANLSLEGNRCTLELCNVEYITDLSYADLSYADLSHADLSYADLSHAFLINANLSSADLSDGNHHFSGADLSYADLSGAKGVTNEQLNAAKSLKGATMPDGSQHP